MIRRKQNFFFSNSQTFETLFQLHFFFFKALKGNEINTIKHRGKNIQLYVFIYIYIYTNGIVINIDFITGCFTCQSHTVTAHLLHPITSFPVNSRESEIFFFLNDSSDCWLFISLHSFLKLKKKAKTKAVLKLLSLTEVTAVVLFLHTQFAVLCWGRCCRRYPVWRGRAPCPLLTSSLGVVLWSGGVSAKTCLHSFYGNAVKNTSLM